MINSKTKPVFITNSSKVTQKIYNYIVNDLGISNAEYRYMGGKDIIAVPTDKYEEVLSKGKKFAYREQLDIDG